MRLRDEIVEAIVDVGTRTQELTTRKALALPVSLKFVSVIIRGPFM